MNELAEVAAKLSVADKADILTKATRAEPEQTVAILVSAGVIEPKPWWRSIGINGSLVSLVGGMVALGAAGAHAYGWEVDAGALTEAIMGLIGLIAAAMTWWGRVHAAQPISRTQVAPGLKLAE